MTPIAAMASRHHIPVVPQRPQAAPRFPGSHVSFLVKLRLYQRAEVREYWSVNPENQTVQVMLLDSGGALQLHAVYDRAGVAMVNVLDGSFIERSKVVPA